MGQREEAVREGSAEGVEGERGGKGLEEVYRKGAIRGHFGRERNGNGTERGQWNWGLGQRSRRV